MNNIVFLFYGNHYLKSYCHICKRDVYFPFIMCLLYSKNLRTFVTTGTALRLAYTGSDTCPSDPLRK